MWPWGPRVVAWSWDVESASFSGDLTAAVAQQERSISAMVNPDLGNSMDYALIMDLMEYFCFAVKVSI